MALEIELSFFEAHREQWLKKHEGEYALIKGEEVAFFDGDGKAYEAGIDKWGDESFLVKQVLKEDASEESPSLLFGLLQGLE